MRGRKGIEELERRVASNPWHYRYVITVNGRAWAYGRYAETVKAAAESARRGWARGQQVEVVELNADGSVKS